MTVRTLGGAMRRMSVPARLTLFASLLLLSFAIAFTIGSALQTAPPGSSDDATHTGGDAAERMAHA